LHVEQAGYSDMDHSSAIILRRHVGPSECRIVVKLAGKS
jgi:hypothetical protein